MSCLLTRGRSETERDEHILRDLLRREEGRERERLPERKRDKWDEREPSCVEEDTEPSLSERRPKPVHSSSRMRFLIRLD